MIKITDYSIDFTREPLLSPFGFKGKSVDELWQIGVKVIDENSNFGFGTGIQSVLWSDGNLFSKFSKIGGNILMLAITEKALMLIKNKTFENPIEAESYLYTELKPYADFLSGEKATPTFVLNALVPIDLAIWQLYMKINSYNCDDVFAKFAPKLKSHQKKLVSVPLITYGLSESEIKKLVQSGSSLLKIKIGSDPEKDNNKEKMIDWDINRILQIHNICKNENVDTTKSGKILYYLDANGRYETKEQLNKLISALKKHGILENIAILEEPFSPENNTDVSDFPVLIAGDESIHSLTEAKGRIALGYKAIALKPIAKTFSESLKIATFACEHNISCFCADLTVNPFMVEWNKCFAARILALPKMNCGILESNGSQNYINWNLMQKITNGAKVSERSIFDLNAEFYNTDGGILNEQKEYQKYIFERGN